MKRLRPIEEEEFEVFLALANSKPSVRAELARLAPYIRQRYEEYQRICHDLAPLTASTLTPSEKITCRECYDPPVEWTRTIKWAIKEKQGPLARTRCQYCGLNEPGTFDHYAPKGRFAEFSVMQRNLIPCCSICNTEKDEEWTVNGRRQILNFYYDAVESRQYVHAIVTYNAQTSDYTVDFDVPDVPADSLSRIVESHVRVLGLKERWASVASDVVTDVWREVRRNVQPDDVDGVIRIVADKSLEYRNRYGVNHWRSVVVSGLLKCDDFLLNAAIHI